jgi:glutamate racemase
LLGSPAKLDSGIGAMAVYIYILKKRPYTERIMMNDSTQMNSPPMSVTAHRGIDSKKPQSSTAVTISCESTVAVGNRSPPRS